MKHIVVALLVFFGASFSPSAQELKSGSLTLIDPWARATVTGQGSGTEGASEGGRQLSVDPAVREGRRGQARREDPAGHIRVSFAQEVAQCGFIQRDMADR